MSENSHNAAQKMIKHESAQVTFYGGVGSVTGANFLLEDNSIKILVDCGLIQGKYYGKNPNEADFGYDPASIDVLLITHAHIDHIGRIGKLVKEGFTGKIYSTPATRDLAVLMLEDAVKVMGYQAEAAQKRKLYEAEDRKKHPHKKKWRNYENQSSETEDTEDDSKIETLYEQHHVDTAMSMWHTIEYHETKSFGNFTAQPFDAGHVLGSCMYKIVHTPSDRKILFTGDLGNSPTPLLKDTEEMTGIDYVIMESVYGDRNHEDVSTRQNRLKYAIQQTIKRKGTLIIPVFSLEKTQALLHEMNDMIESGDLQQVPVFLDSPLGIKLTHVYEQYKDYFNDHIQGEFRSGDNVFDFPKLTETMRRKDSEAISNTMPPKIIIASSGMSEGGRVTAHEKEYLPHKENALIMIGYQVAGSLGRRILEGAKSIQVGDATIPVKAEVIRVDGYSSHKDSDGLLEFVSHTADTVKRVFCVMGEPKSALFLVQKIRDNLGVSAEHPGEGETVVLE